MVQARSPRVECARRGAVVILDANGRERRWVQEQSEVAHRQGRAAPQHPVARGGDLAWASLQDDVGWLSGRTQVFRGELHTVRDGKLREHPPKPAVDGEG